MDIHEWHEFWQDRYAEQERKERRVRLLQKLIVSGAVLAAFLNILLLAYARYAGK